MASIATCTVQKLSNKINLLAWASASRCFNAHPCHIFSYCFILYLVDVNIHAENHASYVTTRTSLNIFCTAYGTPIPIVYWTLNNQITRFNQTDVSVEPYHTSNVKNMSSGFPGEVVSTLHIVDYQDSEDEGVYVCIGSNTFRGRVATSSAAITVDKLGM